MTCHLGTLGPCAGLSARSVYSFMGLLEGGGLGPSQLSLDPQLSFELGKHLRTFNRCLWNCAWEMAMAPRF